MLLFLHKKIEVLHREHWLSMEYLTPCRVHYNLNLSAVIITHVKRLEASGNTPGNTTPQRHSVRAIKKDISRRYLMLAVNLKSRMT